MIQKQATDWHTEHRMLERERNKALKADPRRQERLELRAAAYVEQLVADGWQRDQAERRAQLAYCSEGRGEK